MRPIRRWFKPFRACALLAVRNEEQTLGRCLDHLAEQGLVAAVIDNESTDGTPALLDRYPRSFLIHRTTHPYPGYYDWQGLLAAKQQLAVTLEADWFLHVDADEIPEAPAPYATLAEALRAVDRTGANTVNFHEFVFVPDQDDRPPPPWDYVEAITRYYFFAPAPLRLLRAWKAHRGIDLVTSGGHQLTRPNRKIHPEAFPLRHYIGLSRRELLEKYRSRIYAEDEVARGWHHNRIGVGLSPCPFPAPEELIEYRNDRHWDTSRPVREHFFTPPRDTTP